MIQPEERYMRRCFELALGGLGHVAPNPVVGAVVVADGKIIGEGFHRRWGGPHAEVNAIASVSDVSLLPQSTIYVSLEPCSHYGKTPPCAKLLIEKRISRVVVSCLDPFPKVSGRGIAMLREAGAEVQTGVLEDEGWELNRRFFTFHLLHRPYVILKWAQTADGFIAGPEGTRLPISTPATLPQAHLLRATESAILVGAGTAVSDNPSLTVRYAYGDNPVRILLDASLRTPSTSHLLSDGGKTLVFTSSDHESSAAVEFIKSPSTGGAIDLSFVMDELYRRQLQSLIVEGGAAVHNAFIKAGLVDEFRVETNLALVARSGTRAPVPYGRLVSTEVIGHNVIAVYRASERPAARLRNPEIV